MADRVRLASGLRLGDVLGLMGLFRVLLSEERRGVRYLSDSSYWLYLAHLPAEVKFVMVSVGVTVLLLLSYQLFIRSTPIGTILNGRKARPSARIKPATVP